ncbi:MAG: hypothetical protein Kow00129_05570 [Thermoleophilia bacterium]
MIPALGRPRVVPVADHAQTRKAIRLVDLDWEIRSRLIQAAGAAGIVTVPDEKGIRPDGGGACLLVGTESQFDDFLRVQGSGDLEPFAASIRSVLAAYSEDPPPCHPGLDLQQRPLIMGIVNVTPDSFSDGGDFFDETVAIEQAQRMVEEGASLVDVGGESTRPGSERVDLEEELRRVVPVVEALAGDLPAGISVDTYKAQVAAAALEAGAYMINDISALRFDPEMAAVLRDAGCPVVLMHMLGEPRTMQDDPRYDDVVSEVYDFFVRRLDFAVEAGIAEENLIVDPGIGFGKTLAHNLALLREIDTFRSLGRPVLLGASRKRFLGEILGLPEPKDRVHGTVATSVLAALQHVDILRVHDVAANSQAVQTVRAIFPRGRERLCIGG